MSTINILEEKFHVTSSDTDFTKTLKPGALINMLIQIAWHHANILDFGTDLLHKENLVWVLSRIHVKINHFPFWNEELFFSTWPKGIRRLFYLRDFEVCDSQNNIVARATSEWLLIDSKSKRPKLIHPENNIFQQNKDKHALTNEVPVLETIDPETSRFSNTVKYSDLDLNRHLTTTRYIDWMTDTFDIEFLSKHKCKEIVANFLREIPYNETVDILRSESKDATHYNFAFRKPQESNDFFRGKLCFKS
jgi:medium-chain acyl-[acyl-carrier-protein] hydrolase